MAIRPTFYGFETAKRALNISQAGLDTVGHNIANVDTNGYTRQRVDQVSVGSTISAKYQVYKSSNRLSGQGASMNGISQIRNTYLDTRYRNEACNYGEKAIKSSGLEDLESIFDEMSSTGLTAALGEFIQALTIYQATPDSTEYAVNVRSTAQAFVAMLNQNAAQVETVYQQQVYDLEVAVAYDINTMLEEIAYLNEQIRVANMYGDPANELNNTRNLLIDQLSEYLPIKVVNTPETLGDGTTISRMSIVLVDSSTVPATEIMLVDNEKYRALDVSTDDDGFVSIGLKEVETGYVFQDITNSISSGAVKGYIDMINGLGEFAGDGDNTYRGVAYYREYLNAYAQSFADLMNGINSISAAEAAGKDNIYEYQDKNLFVASDGGTITAANITISEYWKNDPTYLTTTKSDIYYVQIFDENDNAVLDENGNPTYEATSHTETLLEFVEALENSQHYFYGYNGDGDRFVLFRGSFEEGLVNLESTLALDQSTNNSLLEGSYTVIATYAQQRSSVSAVSIDEEAINMMTYSSYYSAAARYMTVLDEALDLIISGMGLVGR